MSELTAGIVRELLDCDIETGEMRWKERDVKWFKQGKRTAEHSCKIWNTKNAGQKASRLNPGSGGYFRVRIFNKFYPSHRIIWLWHYGKWPDHQIDHLDGNPANNKIDNLADKTNAENGKNRKMHAKNISGYPGVSWCTREQKWKASVNIQGKPKHLGYFEIKEDAYSAFLEKARENNYTERHVAPKGG